MIPATHWADNNDGTAWLVEEAAPDSPSGWPATRNDRPCDTCGGDCEDGPNYHTPIAWHCPDCIDGRHTFDIEVVGYSEHGRFTRTHRVSIVPGMVLPIEYFLGELCIRYPDGTHANPPLPADAKPGMRAIQLRKAGQ